MPRQRVRIIRGETTTTVTADVESGVVRFPCSSLTYRPAPNMGLIVNGRPVDSVRFYTDEGPPSVGMVELTLNPKGY